ncbi:acetylcholine receptor subunit alpha-1-B-like [Dreissena polymorpha]|uniref:Uncharacterized protein n=1 Tax=Dreissena polymorpha TaxID=45954 RepID=A0A9D4JY20_DREPO|nr:acetylcholine receptor subunit alpha-1-B-like [Dreissena polymorpha]KAH3828980.1 hypothetical protein DPMN_130968 [Dreissena polymorpha]
MNTALLWLMSVVPVVLMQSSSTTWDKIKAEYVSLYDAYSHASSPDSSTYHTIVPRSDATVPLPVSVSFELFSIGGFDAVDGALNLIGSLNMSWKDETGNFPKSKKHEVDTVIVDYSKVWTPVIVMVNSADSVSRVGDSTYKVRFNLQTAQVNWKPRMIAKAACEPDMTYFPFDQQNCELSFTTWFQNRSILTLTLGSSEWNLDNYDVNGVWEIEETTAEISEVGGYDYAKFTIKFNRNPMYFVINLVFPVLLLSLLSGFVFILPAASGERVGFGITCFLSFMVLLQTIMIYMPQTSSPMSLFCYYVILMLLFSGFLSIVTILLLKVSNDSGTDVPKWLVHFVEIIKCIKIRKLIRARKNKRAITPASDEIDLMRPRNIADSTFRSKFQADRITDEHIPTGPVENGASKPENAKNDHAVARKSILLVKEFQSDNNDDNDDGKADTDENASGVTWESVGGILDTFFFIAFLGAQAALSVFFLVPIATRV